VCDCLCTGEHTGGPNLAGTATLGQLAGRLVGDVTIT